MPDILIPVPLHKQRLVERGFNQSLEISRAVSKQLPVPIDTQCVRRVKSTQAQQTLNITQRKQNIKGCFEMQQSHNYKHVVLIDDVITTGSTVNELAHTLKKSGVEKVGVWSIARAVLK
jgi:ComF family protein